MRATIIVDNMCLQSGLLAEWGYCVHLETPDGGLLLDTGGPGHIVLPNLRKLELDPARIGQVVLSHGHYDHVSGLADILSQAPHAAIWGAPSIGTERRGDADAGRFNGGGQALRLPDLHPVDPEAVVLPGVTAFCVPQAQRDPAFQVSRNLWEMNAAGVPVPDTFADDLSLLVEGPHGFSLLLGCAHTGLPNILRYVHTRFGVHKLFTVLGGTHLSAFSQEKLEVCVKELQTFTVSRWRPNHCTGFAAAAALARVFADVSWAGAGTRHEL